MVALHKNISHPIEVFIVTMDTSVLCRRLDVSLCKSFSRDKSTVVKSSDKFEDKSGPTHEKSPDISHSVSPPIFNTDIRNCYW